MQLVLFDFDLPLTLETREKECADFGRTDLVILQPTVPRSLGDVHNSQVEAQKNRAASALRQTDRGLSGSDPHTHYLDRSVRALEAPTPTLLYCEAV